MLTSRKRERMIEIERGCGEKGREDERDRARVWGERERGREIERG